MSRQRLNPVYVGTDTDKMVSRFSWCRFYHFAVFNLASYLMSSSAIMQLKTFANNYSKQKDMSLLS